MADRKKIFITGASSGLGRQMAIEFAKRGYDLGLAARRLETLEAFKLELLQTSKVAIYVYQLDVTEFETVEPTLLKAVEDMGEIDIVVANSGVGVTTTVGVVDFAETRRTIDTNITGAMATIDAAVKYFRQRGKGHVVGISSVAGFRGFAGTGIYSASKAALSVYLQSLRAELWFKDIVVTDLAPGYIDTAINEKAPNRPFLITLEKGGWHMANLIEKKVAFSTVPSWPWGIVSRVLRILPASVTAKYFR